MSDFSHWDFFIKQYGHAPGQAPSYLPIVRNISSDMLDVVDRYAPEFIKITRALTKKYGFDNESMKYLFWVLAKDRQSWPPLQKHAYNALLLALYVSQKSGDFPYPSFDNRAGIPDINVDYDINDIIRKLSEWCLKKMIPNMKKDMKKLIKRHSKTLRAQGITDSRKPDEWLEARFVEEATQRPQTLANHIIISFLLSIP